MRMILFAFLALTFTLPAYAEKKAGVIERVWRADSAQTDAENLIKEGKNSEALNTLGEITRRNVRNADAHVATAIAWLNLGDRKRAKDSINNAIAVDPNHMGAYVIAGMIALREMDKEQALSFLAAIKTICQGETCEEYQYLQKITREAPF